MRQSNQNISASAPMRRLQSDEMRAMTPQLQRCVGEYGLMIGTTAGDPSPPALPMLGCWITMNIEGSRYQGDVRAISDESLPFIDDAFELVLLQHALEATTFSTFMLDDVIRVLAPRGVLAITGIHPMSVWAAWRRWKNFGSHPALNMPLKLIFDLQQAGFEIEQSQRTGCVFPSSEKTHELSSKWLGGGYVIIARKKRRTMTPLRIQPSTLRAPANARLAPSTRRSAAL